MTKKRCGDWKLSHTLTIGLSFFALIMAVGSYAQAPSQKPLSSANKIVWPFDQRQIALLKYEGQGFPDEATVATILDAFVKKGRVRWVTQRAGASQIVPLEVPKDFAWQSTVSVRNLGLKLKADGMLVLSQRGVQINLYWYATADGQPIYYDTVNLPDSGDKAEDLAARKERLQNWLNDIWSRIPGQGYVVRRDLKNIYLEGVMQNGGKVGDLLEIKRLEKIERHPLLKTVIGMSASLSGRARISAVDASGATAEIEYESQVDPIFEGDRYIILQNEKNSGKSSRNAEFRSNDNSELRIVEQADGRQFVPLFGESVTASTLDDERGSDAEAEPKYKVLDLSGWATFGSVTHIENVSGDTEPKTMKAWSPGFRINLLGYITSDVLLLTDIDFSYIKFKNLTALYAVDSMSSGITAVRVAAAYRSVFMQDGPAIGALTFHLGFRRVGMSMATIAADNAPSAKSYSGYDLGAMIQLPLVQQYSGYLKVSKILMAKLAEAPETGGLTSSNSVWQFETGAKLRLNPTTELMAGILFDSAASTFTGSGTRTSSSVSTALSSTVYQLGGTFKF